MKKTTSNSSSILGLVAVLALAISTPACSSDSDEVVADDLTTGDTSVADVTDDVAEPDTEGDAVEPVKTTAIRVLHLSPDAPAVDIWVNGAAAAVEDLAFPDGTGYLEIPEGEYAFDIVPAGAAVTESVLNVALELAADKKYTAVAIGNVAELGALALEDDYTGLEAGDIRIRAIHAAPAVGEVDIWVIPEMGEPFALYENVPFGVAGDYKTVPAGAYTLGFDVNNDGTPNVIFEVPELVAGTVANVFAVNDDEGNLFLRAQFEDGSLLTIEPVM